MRPVWTSWEDLNLQARQWCDRVNATYKKHIRAVPRELFALERMHLKPLPAWIPEVYRLHERMVDVESYVSLHTNRYSVPVGWIGRRVEVRETKDKVEIQLDARQIVTYARLAKPCQERITRAEHRPPRSEGLKRSDPHPEEEAIRRTAPELAGYVVGYGNPTPGKLWTAGSYTLDLFVSPDTWRAENSRCTNGPAGL